MRLTARIATAAVLLAAGPITPASAAETVSCKNASGGVQVMPWSHDVGTGEDDGTPHAFTAVDPEWNVVAPTAGPAYSIAPNSAWVTSPNANWINSRTTSASGGGGGVVIDVDLGPASPGLGLGPLTLLPTTTTFRTTFTMPALSINRSLNLQFAADNGVTFRLNGTPIGGYDPPVQANGIPNASAFNTLHPLVWAGAGFVDGVNTLDAVVTDYGVATGLLVLGSANACVPGVSYRELCIGVSKDHAGFYTYPPAAHDVGTGESGNTPFAPGTVDDDWTTSAPVSGPAYAVATYPGWVGSTTSSWLNSQASATAGLFPTRTYRIEFPIGDLAQYHDLDLTYAADNGVLFFLNGAPIGGYDPPLGAGGVADVQAFRTKHHLTWTGAGFLTGTNVLTAVVSDYGVASGLLVEGAAHDCGRGVLS